MFSSGEMMHCGRVTSPGQPAAICLGLVHSNRLRPPAPGSLCGSNGKLQRRLIPASKKCARWVVFFVINSGRKVGREYKTASVLPRPKIKDMFLLLLIELRFRFVKPDHLRER